MWKRIGVFMAVSLVMAGLIGLIQSKVGPDMEIIEVLQFAPVFGVLALLPWWKDDVARVYHKNFDINSTVIARCGIATLATGAIFGGIWVLDRMGVNALDVIGTSELKHSFLLIVIAQFIGATAEEVGWRCYLQPELEQRYSLPIAALITGLLWAFWHTPILFAGPVIAICFFISAISWSVLMAVMIWRANGHALWIAGLFHTLINLGLLMWMHTGMEHNAPSLSLAGVSALGAIISLLIWSRAKHTSPALVPQLA